MANAFDELTPAGILSTFAEELAACGGQVRESYDYDDLLFVRGVLPRKAEVAANDQVQGGVALRADSRQIDVHPYVFRLVCRNGAIMAQSVATRRIEITVQSPWEAFDELRLAVRECCDRETFASSAKQMRELLSHPIDKVLNLVVMAAAHLPSVQSAAVIRQILSRFTSEDDQSAFGLMNAVTATARDTRDPEMKWRLEELGGAVAASALKPLPQRPRNAVRKVTCDAVA